MTDAATARHKDQRARRHPRYVARVVAGTGNDVACGIAAGLRALTHTAHASRIEVHRRLIEYLLDVGIETEGTTNLGCCGAPFALHGIECVGLRMAQIDREEDFARNNIGGIWLDLEKADRANRKWCVPVGNAIDPVAQPRRPEQRIFTEGHRRRTAVPVFTANDNLKPADTLN